MKFLKKTSRTAAAQSYQCLGRSVKIDYGSLHLSDAARKFHRVPNHHYTLFPLDL